MHALLFPPTGQVELSADREGLSRLATLVATGQGSMAGDETGDVPGCVALTRLRVDATSDDLVLVTADAGTRSLLIAGAQAHRDVLAETLDDLAAADDGGHVHIEHYPDHPYLRAGSAPLVVNSPLGGMPIRP